MTNEQNKFVYTDKDKDKNGNFRCQGHGFVAVIAPDTNDVIQYDKGGGTFGYESKMIFYPKENIVDFKVTTSENLTAAIATEADVKLNNLMDTYRDKDKNFNRKSCISDYKEGGAKLIAQKVKTNNIIKRLSASPKVTSYVQNLRNKLAKTDKSHAK
jgi:hypothetical protein